MRRNVRPAFSPRLTTIPKCAELVTQKSKKLPGFRALTVDRSFLFGVIDIGSNSVRLVVFDLSGGYPLTVFNDRVFCALGKGVGETGNLSREGCATALSTIRRYVGLAEALGVGQLELVATAALRDARNGAAFAEEIRAQTGCKVDVISGDDEARLAARGVAYASPGADGLVGDLGNGSLELVELAKGEIGARLSLPIGSLRIMSQFGGDLRQARAEAMRQLGTVGWLERIQGRTFYPVGGSWRMLCRIHMAQNNAPLHIIHAYAIAAAKASDFSAMLAQLSARSLAGIPAVQSRRIDAVPIASTILGAVISLAKPKNVVFSAAGVREGVVVDRVAQGRLAPDPLIAAAAAMGRRLNRWGDVGEVFFDWMNPLYPRAREERERLRYVSALLSDIGWREHPDYRARQTMLQVLRLPFMAIDHPSRAALAWALYTRYGGKADNPDAETVIGMMSNRALKRAEVVGRALRLAHRLSGSSPALLSKTRLSLADNILDLHMPADEIYCPEERLAGPLKSLASAAGYTPGRILRHG